MNYKLLFEMECEKHRQTDAKLKQALYTSKLQHVEIEHKGFQIESLKYDIAKLEIHLSQNWASKGEVQPKLQQRITEIYC